MKKITVLFCAALMALMPATISFGDTSSQNIIDAANLSPSGFVFSDASGQIFQPLTDEHIFADPTTNPRMRLINFLQWSQCYLLSNETFVLKTYTVGQNNLYSGSTALQCGSPVTQGYLHIEDGHMSQWDGLRANFGLTNISWDDFMDNAVQLAFTSPQQISDVGNGKACFAGVYSVTLSNGYCYTFGSTVIVSRTARRVITAYPSGHC
jgi:hypothetical protein